MLVFLDTGVIHICCNFGGGRGRSQAVTTIYYTSSEHRPTNNSIIISLIENYLLGNFIGDLNYAVVDATL